MFFKSIRTKKNSDRLYKICMDLIEKFENDKTIPSCKSDLGTLIKQRISAAKKEISEWQDCDTDYIEIAHNMLSHAAFDLLVSGEYHLYYGMLNPMNCSSNLMKVYKGTMDYAVKHNLLTGNEREEDYNYLIQRISQVG